MIPESLQKPVQMQFHAGHKAVSYMKVLMYSYVYWLGMDREIEDLVKSYQDGALSSKLPTVKTQPWPKTDKP